MITLLKSYIANPTGKDNIVRSRAVMKLAGLSTDEKPLIKYKNIEIENGSSFIEIDTSKIYKYDEENGEWIEQVKGSNKDIIIENNALLTYINEITGGDDSNLSAAVATLADGYGMDGYTVDDLANKSKPSGAITFNTATKIYSRTFSERYGITSIDSTTVIDIETGAFQNNTGLITVNLPELKTVTGSTGAMFQGCTKLTTFIAPKLTNIQQNMFNSCSALVSVDFRSVKTISAQGFSGCSKISHLYLPKCSAISARAFNGCTSLTDVYLPNDESTYTNAPWNAPATCTIHYNTQFDENGEPILD